MRGLSFALPVLAAVALDACGSHLPPPPRATPPRSAFAQVPYPPPPAKVERVPPRPEGHVVWVDGSWEWSGTRWRWRDGGWFERPAAGVAWADWALVRHGETRLLYASATWRDATGTAVPGPRRLASAAIGSTDEADGGEPDAGEVVGSTEEDAGPAPLDGGAAPPEVDAGGGGVDASE